MSFTGYGEANPAWAGDEATYSGKHRRIRDTRGRAKDYVCVDCCKPATQWSHIHGTDDGDAQNYEPRCVPCHMVYDGRVAPSVDRRARSETYGLTETQVVQIREMIAQRVVHREIALLFNLHPANVSHIKTGRAWWWLP